jgi:hypothetical protein
MKLISICILLFTVSSWSVFGVKWASLQFENGYLNIDTTKTCNVDTSYVNCSLEKGHAYYSTLDTDYAVFSNPRIAEIQVYGWIPDSLATSFVFRHDIKEVLRFEFMKWQEWGILNMTKDSAQNLINRVVDEYFVVGCRMHHAARCEEDRSACMCSPAGGGAGGGVSNEDAARLPQKKILAESAEPAPADSSAKDPVGEQPKDSAGVQEGDSANVTTPDSTEKPLFISRGAPVGGSLLGLRYSEFDVNGVFIRSGIWQGSLKATGSTRVVRFENGKTAIFR